MRLRVSQPGFIGILIFKITARKTKPHVLISVNYQTICASTCQLLMLTELANLLCARWLLVGGLKELLGLKFVP